VRPLLSSPTSGKLEAKLAAALNELDSFPTLLWRGGRPVLEGGWHEEIAADRKLGSHGTFRSPLFTTTTGTSRFLAAATIWPAADYFQDYFSNGFAYDGGSSGNWGMRLAVRERLSDNLEITAIYAYAGALAYRTLSTHQHATCCATPCTILSGKGLHKVAAPGY